MGRKSLPAHKKLGNIVCTRVTEAKYRELKGITEYRPHYSMGHLVRCILDNRRVKIYASDPSIESALEKLRIIRERIRLTGTFINLESKQFNSHPHPAEKEFFAKQAFRQYATLEPLIYQALEIIQEASKRWLDENSLHKKK
jgi:hypothetical protein